jgi:hypothetical protein
MLGSSLSFLRIGNPSFFQNLKNPWFFELKRNSSLKELDKVLDFQISLSKRKNYKLNVTLFFQASY